MSTIPGGCFVAPDSLRRLKQHAREVKMQQAVKLPAPPDSPVGSPRDSHLVPPPALSSLDHGRSSTFADMFTTAPMRLSEMFGRTRSVSSPPPTAPASLPPTSPPLSPVMSRSPPRDPIPIPMRRPDRDSEIRTSLSESI